MSTAETLPDEGPSRSTSVEKARLLRPERRGDHREVRALLTALNEEYQALLTENLSLRQQIAGLETALADYRREEQAFRAAIVTLQKQYDGARARAEEDARAMVLEAEAKSARLVQQERAEADRVLAEARARAARVERYVQMLQQYQAQFYAVVGRAVSDLDPAKGAPPPDSRAPRIAPRADAAAPGAAETESRSRVAARPARTQVPAPPQVVPFGEVGVGATGRIAAAQAKAAADAEARADGKPVTSTGVATGAKPARQTTTDLRQTTTETKPKPHAGAPAETAGVKRTAAASAGVAASSGRVAATVEQIDEMLKSIDGVLVDIPALPLE